VPASRTGIYLSFLLHPVPFLLLRCNSAAIISSLFFTVRPTRDPLPNYRREDNHPWTNRLPAVAGTAPPPRCRRAAASFSRRESPRENPVIIIPASNASPGHDDDRTMEREAGEDANRFSRNCSRLSAFLHVKSLQRVAAPGHAMSEPTSAKGTARLRAAALRGHSKLGVREPRIYEVTFLGAREILLCVARLQILSTNGTVSLTSRT